MSYGFQAFDENGAVKLDENWRIPRVIFSGLVASSGSMVLAGFDIAKGFVVFRDVNGLTAGSYAWDAVTETLSWATKPSDRQFYLYVGAFE